MTPPALPYLLGTLALGGLVLLAPRFLARAAGAFRMLGPLRRARAVRDTDLARAAAYHRGLPNADRGDALDDRTWDDLDLDAVFLALDRTASEPGRQYLYHLLRTPTSRPEPLRRLERVIDLGPLVFTR